MKDRIIKKIIKNTPIKNEGEAFWYKKFIEASGLTDQIVMSGQIVHEICRLFSLKEGKVHNYYVETAKKEYQSLLKKFKEKKLVEEIEISPGIFYPKIIGYNFYNDPKVYLGYRKKGEEGWNGRLPVSDFFLQKDLIKHLSWGDEIREKPALSTLLN